MSRQHAINNVGSAPVNQNAVERAILPRTSIAIAAFSTVVEWYDFTLYLYLATLLSRVFFGGGAASVLTTLGGFAVAYLMRPIGALAFGYIGDRHGRRLTMLISMAIMSVAMVATAFLPTFAEIGPAAGLLLLLIRCVMGFSVGGEYTGVVAYLLEGAPAHRRGLITSLAAAASEVGALLAAGVSALTVASMSHADLVAWGWRIPFFVGAGLAAAVLVARAGMHESPDFLRQREAGSVPPNPIAYSLANHRSSIARGFAISALGSITYYVGITYVPVFLTSTGGTEAGSLWLATIAAAAVIAVTPVFGMLSDRYGRKPILIGLAVASAALPVTMFSLMAGVSGSGAIAGSLVLAALAGGVSAVAAAATGEQFPGEARLTGLAFGVTMATAIFGGLTPYLAQILLERTGWAPVPGAMIAIVACCVLPILFMMPETAHQPIADESGPRQPDTSRSGSAR
jgi:MFS transporter, MHS family, proline/betaine transporter